MLSMISCEKSMNIEVKTNDKLLLVSGEFTNDTTVHAIRLFCSGSFMTGQPQTVVSGARIFVTDNIDTITYIERADSPGIYQTPSNCFGIGGHMYTLNISNVDIDGVGKYEEYTAQTMMPVPVRFDSMVSFYSMNGDNIEGTVKNSGYYTTFYNGPDYLYNYVIVSNENLCALTSRLGSGELTTYVYEVKKVSTPGLIANGAALLWIDPTMAKISEGDTICMVGLNFNKAQYEFLGEFDKNTTSQDLIEENLYDQLRIPTNLPTNIQPSDKAAGYFFIYSISRISKVFEGGN
jgi:hypothetical protein